MQITDQKDVQLFKLISVQRQKVTVLWPSGGLPQ